tara:strand:+ start:261 stop:422 length:162 start_codon:yes stop_codon:yes gene_type:complete
MSLQKEKNKVIDVYEMFTSDELENITNTINEATSRNGINLSIFELIIKVELLD